VFLASFPGSPPARRRWTVNIVLVVRGESLGTRLVCSGSNLKLSWLVNYFTLVWFMALCLASLRSSTLNIPSPFLSAILGPKVTEVVHFSDCWQPSHTPSLFADFDPKTLPQNRYSFKLNWMLVTASYTLNPGLIWENMKKPAQSLFKSAAF